jgi:hypothetical protein
MTIIVSFTVAFLHLPRLCLNETKDLDSGGSGGTVVFFITTSTLCCRAFECGELQAALLAVVSVFLAGRLVLH